jgi:hypothetical protein
LEGLIMLPFLASILGALGSSGAAEGAGGAGGGIIGEAANSPMTGASIGGGGGGGGGGLGGLLEQAKTGSPGLENYKKMGGGLSGLGGVFGGEAGAGVGAIAEDVIKAIMLLKSDKMARQHAGWLQGIAANPPRPSWAREMSGPGLNK